jgi:uroporphyrinogen-III synthase
MNALRLAGKRILVTRALHQAGKLSDGLRLLGAEPVEVPVLEIRPPASFEQLDSSILKLDKYDWLVLTSANTVQALVARAAELGVAFAQPASLKVAAIGEGTAEEARKAGFRITFIPVTSVAESLVEGLVGDAAGQRILLARAEVARDLIPDALRDMGAQVDVVDAYRNVVPGGVPQQLQMALVRGIDAATFTSSSSVTHLAEAARQATIPWPFAGVPAVSIGPITSGTLRDLGWEPSIEANPSDIPGLISAVVQLFQR